VEDDDLDSLVESWQPKQTSDVMRRAFAERCRWVETMLQVRAEAEIRMRAANYSSGPAIEAIFREELGRILPRRYQVTCGTLSDGSGNTAGDCDVVVFNDTWFPTVKQRATADDRQHVMPIEGAYAVIEVKQTLTQRSLDEALGKLVTCHRLDRPLMPVGRMVENRSFGGGGNRIGNPLFSAIVATRRDPGTPLSDLVERFLAVNRRLNRLEMVHCLCILGEVCYLWGWVPQGSSEANVATFFGPEDLQQPLMLIEGTPDRAESPLGVLVSRLFAHVTNSVLGEVQDIPWAYGIGHALQPYQFGRFQTPPAQSPGP
jgi:hypothetical protein